MPSRTEILVCLFAKAPQAGKVKTRMQPLLSESECLELHCDLLQLCCSNLRQLPDNFTVQLHITAAHPLFCRLSEEFGFARVLQRGRNLGARMSHAVRSGLQCADSVVLVGADCPGVDSGILEQMQRSLSCNEAVVVPAHDGGYVALGLSRHASQLFCELPWGSSTVAEETRKRLNALGWTNEWLPAQADIDRPEDLRCLPGKLGKWKRRGVL